MDKDAWYYEAVTYVYENGLMNGTDKATFAPEATLTRAMMAQVLYNLEKGSAGAPAVFTDVAADAWYADSVNWAAEKGIVSGYGNGTFGPEEAITREQMAQIIYNYAKYKGYDVTAQGNLSQFTDAGELASWSETSMAWAVAKKLISGTTSTTLTPTGTATRAQVAQILKNFCEAFPSES